MSGECEKNIHAVPTNVCISCDMPERSSCKWLMELSRTEKLFYMISVVCRKFIVIGSD